MKRIFILGILLGCLPVVAQVIVTAPGLASFAAPTQSGGSGGGSGASAFCGVLENSDNSPVDYLPPGSAVKDNSFIFIFGGANASSLGVSNVKKTWYNAYQIGDLHFTLLEFSNQLFQVSQGYLGTAMTLQNSGNTRVLVADVSAGAAYNLVTNFQAELNGTWYSSTPTTITGPTVSNVLAGDTLLFLAGSDKNGTTSINIGSFLTNAVTGDGTYSMACNYLVAPTNGNYTMSVNYSVSDGYFQSVFVLRPQ